MTDDVSNLKPFFSKHEGNIDISKLNEKLNYLLSDINSQKFCIYMKQIHYHSDKVNLSRSINNFLLVIEFIFLGRDIKTAHLRDKLLELSKIYLKISSKRGGKLNDTQELLIYNYVKRHYLEVLKQILIHIPYSKIYQNFHYLSSQAGAQGHVSSRFAFLNFLSSGEFKTVQNYIVTKFNGKCIRVASIIGSKDKPNASALPKKVRFSLPETKVLKSYGNYHLSATLPRKFPTPTRSGFVKIPATIYEKRSTDATITSVTTAII